MLKEVNNERNVKKLEKRSVELKTSTKLSMREGVGLARQTGVVQGGQ